ncbi:MAG: transcriptional regulator, GntR family [Deltaproteobacteria bacterium]|nr:transcriptional regulator, GntR family [Deltaproteobacteria bacterium]
MRQMKRVTTEVENATPSEGQQDASAWVRVYEFLKEGIINGTYGPGEKLNEREIATLANVSRTPTREALRALEHEGLVSTIAKRGVFVKKYSLEELDVLHRMLLRLESLAVEMAVPRLTKNDLADLQRMTNRMKSLAVGRKYREYLTLNFEFHLFFARKSRSKELLDAISQLRKRIFRFYHAHVTLAHNPKQYVEDHQEIIDALTGKIDKKPARLIETHIDRARTSFMAFYKDFGP